LQPFPANKCFQKELIKCQKDGHREKATYLKPVDGAAVDERRKHAKSVSKGVSDGTHRQHDVQILFHSFDEEVVHGQRRHFHPPSLRHPKRIRTINISTGGDTMYSYWDRSFREHVSSYTYMLFVPPSNVLWELHNALVFQEKLMLVFC